jgi:hypothetical protein
MLNRSIDIESKCEKKKERDGSYGAIIDCVKHVSMLHWTLPVSLRVYWEIRTTNVCRVMTDFCLTMVWVCISCLYYVHVWREMNKLVMPYFFFFFSLVSSLLYRVHRLSEASCVSTDGRMVIISIWCHHQARERKVSWQTQMGG